MILHMILHISKKLHYLNPTDTQISIYPSPNRLLIAILGDNRYFRI